MTDNGGRSQRRTVAFAKLFGLPAGPLQRFETALGTNLKELGADLIDLDGEGAVPRIWFSITVPESEAGLKSILRDAVVSCYPEEVQGTLGGMEVQCWIMAAYGCPESTSPFLPSHLGTIVTASSMWLAAIVMLVTAFYLFPKIEQVASSEVAGRETRSPVGSHGYQDTTAPDCDPDRAITAAGWETLARIASSVHHEGAKAKLGCRQGEVAASDLTTDCCCPKGDARAGQASAE